jgi:uncharacterized protein YkwD
MKKIIVTLCSMALSLAGSFGINQIVNNDEAILDRQIDQVQIEEEAEVVEDITNLPADEIKKENHQNIKDNASEVEKDAPTKKDTKEDKKALNTKDNNVTTKTKKAENDSNSKSETNNAAKKQETSKTTDTTSTNKATESVKQSSNSKNIDKKYIYKNIDLSNCKSVDDVVEVLQQNGYSNVNINNIDNLDSLEDILSLLGKQEGKTSKTPSNTTPTRTPSPTPKEKAPSTTPKNTSNPTNTSNNSYADEVLRLVNIERANAGLSALSTNSSLTAAANKRAEETKASFSHTRPNGSKFSTVLQEYGVSYRTAGENIAYGQRSPQEVVSAWMNSPGHRANILNGNFNKIGIGVYQSGGVIYWTQLFTN